MTRRVQVGRRVQVAGEPLIWTPASVESYLRETDLMFAAVNRDWMFARKRGRVNDAIWKNWTGFLSGWRAFRKDASSWTGASVDRAEDYRDRLSRWRNRLGNVGVKPASEPIPATKPGALQSFARDIGIAVGVAGGTALILWLLRGGSK